MSAIKVENLSFNHSKKVVFDNISLKIDKGKITAIMGPSGCGKTTLLKIIGRQLKQTSGKIEIEGINTDIINNNQLYELRRHIGILFQTSALFSDLNVFENVAFPVREHTDLSDESIRDLVLMKLHAVGLAGSYNLMPSQLSTGMLKRTALARTIVLDPKIIMYDEPFSGQDPISMSILIKLIKLLNDSLKMTTIIVSHDIHETMSIADYVYIINEKKIIAEGTPSDIKNKDDKFVQYFVNGKIIYGNIFQYSKVKYENDLLNI